MRFLERGEWSLNWQWLTVGQVAHVLDTTPAQVRYYLDEYAPMFEDLPTEGEEVLLSPDTTALLGGLHSMHALGCSAADVKRSFSRLFLPTHYAAPVRVNRASDATIPHTRRTAVGAPRAGQQVPGTRVKENRVSVMPPPFVGPRSASWAWDALHGDLVGGERAELLAGRRSRRGRTRSGTPAVSWARALSIIILIALAAMLLYFEWFNVDPLPQ